MHKNAIAVARLSIASYSGSRILINKYGYITMVMQAMHSGRGSKLLKFVFFALLVLATAGLVLTDVGGFFRGGISNNDVAKVGSDKISIVEFDRSARRALARARMTPEQALQLGYMNQILNSEIRRSLFQQIAADNNIKISRKQVAEQINAMLEISARDGQSKQEVLDQILRNQGFSEPEFVRTVASEGAAGILARAVQNPYIGYSEEILKDLYFFQNETREIEYVSFLNNEFTDIKAPSDKELEKLYNISKQAFSMPETRSITVAVIDDKALESTIAISEEQIRSIYESDIESYKMPETRILEQSVVKDADTAFQIYESVQEGASLKEATAAVTGDEKAYLAPQPFQEEGLIDEIAKEIFSAEETGQTFEPLQSPLGWHVITLDSIKEPYTKSFDSVKAEIRQMVLEDELAEQRYELAAQVDDLLAGGAPIEEVKQIVNLETTTIEEVTTAGAMASDVHPLDKYGDDQEIITELAFEFYEGESSPVTELSNGNMAFVHVNKITPQSFKPLEEVKETLKTRWINDQRRLSNRERSIEILNTANTESYGLDKIAENNSKTIKKMNNIKRNQEPEEPLIGPSLETIFSAKVDDLVMANINDGFAIIRVTSSSFPTEAKEETDEIKRLKSNLEKSSTNEAIDVYFEKKSADYDVKVNTDVINRIYGSSNTQ